MNAWFKILVACIGSDELRRMHVDIRVTTGTESTR